MKESWTERLKCPICGIEGTISLTGADFDIPTVEVMPAGFDVVLTEFGISFSCSVCRVAVLP